MEETNKTKDKEEQEVLDLGIKLEIVEKIKQKEIVGQGVIEDQNIYATFPNKCQKCGHDKAQVIELGIWYSDEAGVVRYKCGKCGFVEQDKESNT